MQCGIKGKGMLCGETGLKLGSIGFKFAGRRDLDVRVEEREEQQELQELKQHALRQYSARVDTISVRVSVPDRAYRASTASPMRYFSTAHRISRAR
eukprot:3101906-Rhodomonas_salina.1